MNQPRCSCGQEWTNHDPNKCSVKWPQFEKDGIKSTNECGAQTVPPTTEEFEELKKAADKAWPKHPQVCPQCGYCPTCGRPWGPHGRYPYYPYLPGDNPLYYS